ncbi:DUF1194 domain-containing protein [uncultured Shimia sp.]|uniref:DUF1194 domain-containing protein n=1 Tax=uncultured Shimia sp. TaxID=573152 RepID=UPI002619EF43|nr:DUF1194 domain-containing protein [uncultured Shimia sp.]
MGIKLAAWALGFGMGGTTVAACDLALVLAVDVSGSVDREEYRIQMDGLAAGLRDGIVADALVNAKARVALVQWTGSDRQDMTVPWRPVETLQDVEALAVSIEEAPRQWRNYSTAIGEALEVSLVAMSQVQDCRRKVIDVSGDGRSNEGVAPLALRSDLRHAGITVNALVIETDDSDLTGYFRQNVIVGAGAFVVTANGFADYPARIRQKLVREVGKKLASVERQ